jgi:predicted ATPase
MSLRSLSVKISNYKCFGTEECGFEQILPINVIIGRNNSGKSALLDLIARSIDQTFNENHKHKGEQPSVIYSDILEASDLSSVVTGRGPTHPNDLQRWTKFWGPENVHSAKRIQWRQDGEIPRFISVTPPFVISDAGDVPEKLVSHKSKPLRRFKFFRLLADRDVIPENSGDNLFLGENGAGATNLIEAYVNKVSLPSDLIEVTILRELNSIFHPDSLFTRIAVQRDLQGRWEVYLEEQGKGRISLSNTGSGLKTIILVLLAVYVVPHQSGLSLDRYLFGFEELENNLHPSLLRRLLLYLRRLADDKNCHFFLTTHSSVAIDLFSRDPDAQIIHVAHRGTRAEVKVAKTYVEHSGILDDLDVRASDLLQANVVVWVEGPSDRLYFNRWVELWTNSGLAEGTHYQCVFYGGRLLAHLSGSDPEINPDDVIKILRVNRNAIVLIDSDKAGPRGKLNATKGRIVAEVEDFSGISWVTSGREIENYIPQSVLTEKYGPRALSPLGQFDDIADYLESIKTGEGKSYSRRKAIFAEEICSLLTRQDVAANGDLAHRLDDICAIIKKWNGISD